MKSAMKFFIFSALIGITVLFSFIYSNEVRGVYNRLYQKFFLHEDELLIELKSLYKAGEYREIVKKYRSNESFYAENSDLNQIVVASFIKLKEEIKAAELFMANINGVQSDFSFFNEIRAIPEILFRNKNYGDLVLLYDRGLKRDDVNFAFYYGAALFNHNRIKDAEKMLNYSFENGFIGSEINYYIALTFEKRGGLDRAIFFMERAHEYQVKNRDIVTSLIRLYRKKGDFIKSEVLLRKMRHN